MIKKEDIIITNNTRIDAQYKSLITNDGARLKTIKDKNFDYVIDLGGNVGTFSLYVLYLLNIKKGLIVFEPVKNNFEVLKQNLDKVETSAPIYMEEKGIGSGKNILIFKKYNSDGQIVFKDSDDECGIETMTLKNIFDKYEIKNTDRVLLKCDTEGGERYLMDKESSNILDTINYITLELHYGPRFPFSPSKQEYVEWVKTFRQHFIIIEEKWGKEKNGIVNMKNKCKGGQKYE